MGSARGDIDLHVPEPGPEGTPPVLGVARATWQTDTTATREDGARTARHEIGLLSGGSLALPVGRPLASGDAIRWVGAWWTRPAGISDVMFSSTVMSRSSDGGMFFGDGHVVARPAGPIAFQVDTMRCREITGTMDPAMFALPQVQPDAGLTVTAARATFTLNRR
jgi:hypothetical protein